jgi:hypothetical protein
MTTCRRALSLGAAALAASLTAATVSPPAARADDLHFVPLPPCRVIDTRSDGAGGPLMPGIPRQFFFRGPSRNYRTSPNQGGSTTGCGIPDLASDLGATENIAKAVAINIVAVGGTGPGHLTAWPSNQTPPLASVINYAAIGTNLANGVILPLCDEIAVNPCASGDLSFVAAVSSAHLVVDVVGYFHATPGPGEFTTLSSSGASTLNSLAVTNSATVAATLQIGSNGTPIATVLSGTASLDFSATATQESRDLTITIVGAAVGDSVALGVPPSAVEPDSSFTAWVSAADTVTVRFNNYSGIAQDPGSGNFRVTVIKF